MEERKKIQNRELVGKLRSIKKQSEWVKCCEKLGFRMTHGGKHPYVARDPENPNDGDFRSSVTTIPSHPNPGVNKKIFEQMLNSPVAVRMGITEDAIWKALGF